MIVASVTVTNARQANAAISSPAGDTGSMHRWSDAAGNVPLGAPGGWADDQLACLPHPGPANLAALGGTQLVFCLARPDIPTTAGGATFGAKFLSADLTLTGVFSPLAQGTWFGVWTPWNPGVRTLNAAATAVSPAVIAPGLVTLSGRKLRGVKRLAGRVSQAGASIVTRVQILAGSKRIATVSSQGNGSFSREPSASDSSSWIERPPRALDPLDHSGICVSRAESTLSTPSASVAPVVGAG